MPAKITCVVADDHPMVRRGIVSTLQDETDFEVVGEAATADEAIEIARKVQPQIVVLDINMPGDGLAASTAIKSEHPEMHIVMFSFRKDEEVIRAAREAGASGYIVKGAPGSTVVRVLRRVAAGFVSFE